MKVLFLIDVTVAETDENAKRADEADLTRRSFATITDGLVPALQRRGLVRREYSHPTFRENLFEF